MTSVRIFRQFPGQQAKLCLHCHNHRTSVSRGLCRNCFEELAVRARYPILPRRSRWKPSHGICKHCGRQTKLRPRGLCWACYEDRDIRAQHKGGSAKFDDGLPRLPKIDHYPDHRWPGRCPCGLEFDGSCASCERAQRTGMVIVTGGEEEETDG